VTSQEIQTVILVILVGLVALSVALWVLRQLWAVINTPVAIAIVLAVLGIFLHFTTLEF
jgi:NO-binding membrane sensor protein with MHYT domain